ncbi:hypothetical protein DX130_18220 [Paenibacillus paeoniae]|uniref:SLH domain-containing protein n=1 Tax=Paenibacillus paeoniae TaxID=2292705 RepID=A0A371PEY7_9BACL|nr:hypothetical protein DX130_18220 [Paenibacillus paeoniae]
MSGSTVTIKKEYLAEQPTGTTSLTFTFSAGNTQTLTITVNNTTQTDAEAVAEAKSALAIDFKSGDSVTSVTSDLILPVTGASGTTISWSSSDQVVIANDGKVTRPSYTAGDKTVTLTATITKGGATVTKTFTVTVKAKSAPSKGDDAGSPPAPDSSSDDTGIILVNGKQENAGTASTGKRNNQTVTTIAIDQKKLDAKLALEGKGAILTILVSAKSDIVIGELNGQIVKNMENKHAVVTIQTGNVAYTLPAQQINIDAISDKVGKSVALQDIKVQIEIAAPTAEAAKVVENVAAKGEFTLVVPSVHFTVKATYGDTTVEVSKFTAYVARTIAIPEGVDPNKITTGVAVEADGTVRHVPTQVKLVDGKYYAIINSMTNSTYSVVWNPLTFSDVANHWAKDAVNDMGSRMVIEGTGDGQFNPDRDITRAEFATILVRGLGLKLENGSTSFSDVNTTDWYNSAIQTAHAYGLIDGYNDGTFRPNDRITREQAMAIIAKSMKLTGLWDKLNAQSAEETLRPFVDAAAVGSWAKNGVAEVVQAGIVSGRSATTLAPKGYMTRAEVAAAIQQLLEQSGLI